jgi:hypothetical protein
MKFKDAYNIIIKEDIGIGKSLGDLGKALLNIASGLKLIIGTMLNKYNAILEDKKAKESYISNYNAFISIFNNIINEDICENKKTKSLKNVMENSGPVVKKKDLNPTIKVIYNLIPITIENGYYYDANLFKLTQISALKRKLITSKEYAPYRIYFKILGYTREIYHVYQPSTPGQTDQNVNPENQTMQIDKANSFIIISKPEISEQEIKESIDSTAKEIVNGFAKTFIKKLKLEILENTKIVKLDDDSKHNGLMAIDFKDIDFGDSYDTPKSEKQAVYAKNIENVILPYLNDKQFISDRTKPSYSFAFGKFQTENVKEANPRYIVLVLNPNKTQKSLTKPQKENIEKFLSQRKPYLNDKLSNTGLYIKNFKIDDNSTMVVNNEGKKQLQNTIEIIWE